MPSFTTIGPMLRASTASELMGPTLVSLRGKATVAEAVALFTDKGYHAAPVIDKAGRPIGVLTQGDILSHDREHGTHLAHRPSDRVPVGFTEEDVDVTLVEDIMTPVIFCVLPSTPTNEVIAELLKLKVHQLFVVDAAGVLVGAISAIDIVRRLV
ncbi:MAG: CBS domain-containing protein [Planctomycetota bacterium]|nr:CBS domain-containing protein [Planctomycetota bacterium]